MRKRNLRIGICFLFFCILAHQEISGSVLMKRRVRASFSAGLGLPKIPISHFRNPVSVLGGGSLNFRLSRKMALQFGGYGLYTFDLGTRSSHEGKLRFDLAWVSLDVLYHLSGVIRSESFVLAGLGDYHLSQQFYEDETVLNTMGLNVGLAYWKHWRRWSSVFEVRWHLLFRPSDNPQVLTLTFGMLL